MRHWAILSEWIIYLALNTSESITLLLLLLLSTVASVNTNEKNIVNMMVFTIIYCGKTSVFPLVNTIPILLTSTQLHQASEEFRYSVVKGFSMDFHSCLFLSSPVRLFFLRMY